MTILGMDFTLFLVMCLVLVIILFFLLILMTQAKYKKAVRKHVYCEFMYKGGSSEARLLPENDGIIEAPKEHKVPGDRYYIRPKKTYGSVYPPGMPKFLQVPCTKAYYAEGNPEPIDPFTVEPIVTSQVLFASINEKFSQLMLESANELYDKLEDIIKMIKLNPTFVYIGLLAAVLLAGVSVYFNFMQASDIKAMKMSIDTIKASIAGLVH